MAVISVCNGDNSIILDSGANNMVTAELIDKNKDIIFQSDALIMQLEIPIETVCYAAKLAHSAGVKVILNPAPVCDLPSELLKNTDVIVLNETEGEYISKISPDSPKKQEECINKIKEFGVDTVVLTLGGEGCVYTNGSGIKYQKAYKTTVVDTTAAGDTFIGAFCLKMNTGLDFAVDYASAAASITVSREGASVKCDMVYNLSEDMVYIFSHNVL